MSEQEIFRLQNEIDRLKNQQNFKVPNFIPGAAFVLMATGIVLSFVGQPDLGYKLALLGFVGFVILYGVQSYVQRREQNTEYRIQEIERRIEELRRR